MGTKKQYKFINSTTGYSIYYHTLNGDMKVEEAKIELEKVKEQVASKHGLLLTTIYWEEIKEGE
ncbi:MAG: hypothetical protein EOO43_19015 [Flavobacterium sp.]|nr:MAG: hypothetical protein EOO43_19015 [Flavobacterium sp.]